MEIDNTSSVKPLKLGESNQVSHKVNDNQLLEYA